MSPITDERLKEILDVTAKATRGPWIEKHKDGEDWIDAPYPIEGHPDAVVSVAFDLRKAELAYFMALQPDVAASIISELLAAREALSAAWAYIDGLQLRAPTPPTVNSNGGGK